MRFHGGCDVRFKPVCLVEVRTLRPRQPRGYGASFRRREQLLRYRVKHGVRAATCVALEFSDYLSYSG